jgi:hypothetical protein
MRITNLTICILLIFGTFNVASSQSFRNKQFALITFNYNIHQSLKNTINEHSNLFPEVEDKKADRIISKFKENTWLLLEDRLQTEVGMYILPLNAHGRSFKYDVYGYPTVSINKALKDGSSKFYLRIDLTINATSTKGDTGYGARSQSRDTSINFDEIPANAIIPQVTITASMYNDKGIIPLQKLTGTYTARAYWLITEDSFNGIVNKKEFNPEQSDTFMGLINLAITDLISKFKI